MAPKRKAGELERPSDSLQHTSKGEANKDNSAAGTLAGASGQSVDTLLGRVGNRRQRALAAKGVKPSNAFPAQKPHAAADAVCGAPAQALAAAEEQKRADHKDAAGEQLESASDWEWEDAADDEEDWETAEAPVSVSGVAGSFDIDATAQAGPSRPRRKGITKEEREMARLLHRTHLLCLLSRGLLFDQAASDALLQATMLSLTDPATLPSIDSTGGVGVTPTALQPLLAWFHRTFQQLPGPFQASHADDDSDLTGAASGVETVVKQLQGVAAARAGTAEELQALFVALCRAQSLLVRSVRVLDPMPLNPGVRRIGSAHLKQQRRPRPKPSATVEAAAGATGNESTAAADTAGKGSRGRKRKSAESVQSHEAEDSGDAAAQHTKTAVSKGGKGKSRKSAMSKHSAEGLDGVKVTAAKPTGSQSAGKGGKGKGKGTRKVSHRKAAQAEEIDPQLEDDLAAACAASLADTPQHAPDSLRPQKAKRAGDIELENQIAMAMASTAAEAQHRMHRKPSASAVHDEPVPSALSPKGRNGKPTLGETWTRDARLPKQDLAQSEAASHWAEVFCGSAELGKWVHADPLLNWLDVPDKVEGAGIRLGGLAYVVAFANQGAKDVTQRYVGSVLAADKLRDNAWWEQTLRPLRKHEVAATTLHHRSLQLNPPAISGDPAREMQQPQGQVVPHGQVATALSSPAAGNSPHAGSDWTSKVAVKAAVKAELALKREDAELSQRVASERRNLPSNVDGFKNHPVYVLERHIGRYFALKPGTKKVGMHRGEGYYPRDALAELHTADRWLRDGLEVRQEELDKPYKVVKRRGVKEPPEPPTRGSHPPADEEAEAPEEQPVIPVPDVLVTKMYGQWQTQLWEVPTAVGGIVPKNDRGNVHCPPLASELPKGTVHLQMPRLGPICKKLGVDYAPAMTGFDIRAGRSVPTIEGVVVCKEDEATVLQAYLQEEQLREERAAERRKQDAEAAWRQLLRSIWIHLRLHQDYGDDAAAHAGQHHADLAQAGLLSTDLSGTADIVDLSQDQDQSAGPSNAAEPGPTLRNLLRESNGAATEEAELTLKAGDPQQHSQSTGKKRSSRLLKGRQEVLHDATEGDTAAGGQQSPKRIQRHSKSGVEVEMEEI